MLDDCSVEKILEIRKYIEALDAISSYEVYRWLISRGKQLNEHSLSEERRVEENRVTQCQADLYVDIEAGEFRAWSNALITAGYATLLADIFNSVSLDECTNITPETIESLGLADKLSMIRKAGFYQMVTMMQERAFSVVNTNEGR